MGAKRFQGHEDADLLWEGSGFILQIQSSGKTLPRLPEENGKILHLRHRSVGGCDYGLSRGFK